MILTGKQILAEMGKKIEIEPFDESRVNPNSYNLSLYNELLVYTGDVLDMKEPNAYKRIKIPEEGLVLEPGKLYLGRTVERTKTDGYVPMLEGRSSVGRLGLCVHVTAGFGDVGFDGYWTLELFCIQPVRIYPYVEICQIYYHTIEGEYEKYGGSGKYNGNSDIQPSMMYKDFGVGFAYFENGGKGIITDVQWDDDLHTDVYTVTRYHPSQRRVLSEEYAYVCGDIEGYGKIAGFMWKLCGKWRKPTLSHEKLTYLEFFD